MSVESLGYIGLAVKDPEAWRGFATQMLGLMPGEGAGGASRYRLDDAAWRISLEAGDTDDIAYLGFEVSGPDDLAALAQRLASGGVRVTTGDPAKLAERGVLGLVACVDPEGLPVEIYFGATLRTETPFVSPAGVARFVTGGQGLGHVVLSTRNIAAARHFYQDLLGFRLSDSIRMRMGRETPIEMEFFHCNPRHHTLALLPIPMPKRLHHFMLQTPSLDDVGFALERAEKLKIPLATTLGRHTNDRMVSFYAKTPSGFDVEFGTGALEVDDATWRVTRHDQGSSWGHHRVA